MKLVDNSVWILKYNSLDYDRVKQLVVFSSKKYAKEYKKSVIDDWIKSITREAVPRRLDSRAEIEQNAKNYPEVIRVNMDHYSLIRGMKSEPGKTIEYWYYEQMSDDEWDKYYKKVKSKLVIGNHTILK